MSNKQVGFYWIEERRHDNFMSWLHYLRHKFRITPMIFSSHTITKHVHDALIANPTKLLYPIFIVLLLEIDGGFKILIIVTVAVNAGGREVSWLVGCSFCESRGYWIPHAPPIKRGSRALLSSGAEEDDEADAMVDVFYYGERAMEDLAGNHSTSFNT
jgi:hypothetical protein